MKSRQFTPEAANLMIWIYVGIFTIAAYFAGLL
jgi:hypothetical protein